MFEKAKGPPTLKLAPPLKLQRHADGGQGKGRTYAKASAGEAVCQ